MKRRTRSPCFSRSSYVESNHESKAFKTKERLQAEFLAGLETATVKASGPGTLGHADLVQNCGPAVATDSGRYQEGVHLENEPGKELLEYILSDRCPSATCLEASGPGTIGRADLVQNDQHDFVSKSVFHALSVLF